MTKSTNQKNPKKPDGTVVASELPTCPYCGKRNESTAACCWVCQATLHQPSVQPRHTISTILGWIVVGFMGVFFVSAAAMIAFFYICISVIKAS